MEPLPINELLIKAALLMVVIERAVAQVKAIAKTDLAVKPWPLISLAISGVLVWTYTLYLIDALMGHGPTNGPMIVGWVVDWAVSTATISGGSAGVIDMVKSLKRTRAEAGK